MVGPRGAVSLGRPDRGSVDDKERLLQILTGLYDAFNGNRTAITQLEQRFISVIDASTTINVGTATSSAVSPIESDREDGGGTDGPAPGSSTSTSMARMWVSTPDPAFPYAVNMGALSSGTLQHTVAAGVSTPSAFAGTTGSIPFYTAGGQLAQDNARLFWDDSNKRLGIFTNAPGFIMDISARSIRLGSDNSADGTRTNNTDQTGRLFVNHYNAGANPMTTFFGASTATENFVAFGGGTSLGHAATNVYFYTAAGILGSSGTLRMTITSSGDVSIVSLAAGGLVKAVAATGVLVLAAAGTDYQQPITWPASGRVLVSTGTAPNNFPGGDANVLLDTTVHEFFITQPGFQSWYNATGGNYERVRAAWGTWSVSGTTAWVVASEKGGAGTVRDVAIDAGVANAYLFGAVATMYGTNTSNRVSIGGTLGAEIGSSFTRASSAGMTLDAIQFTNPADFTISGSTNITTATGVNFVRVARPVYDGGGNAKTITNAAAVYITNAPLAQNGVTITNNYALWVDDGSVRLDGSAFVGAGSGGGILIVNGAGTASNLSITVGNNNDPNRDHVALSVGGGSLYDHPNNSFVHVSPTSQGIAGADFGGTGILATVRIDSLTYSATSGSPSITGAAAFYIANQPTLSGVTGGTYAIWVDAGVCRFDGQVALGGGAAATLGTIGGSGPGTAAQNKWLPINSDGTTYYIPLWI